MIETNGNCHNERKREREIQFYIVYFFIFPFLLFFILVLSHFHSFRIPKINWSFGITSKQRTHTVYHQPFMKKPKIKWKIQKKKKKILSSRDTVDDTAVSIQLFLLLYRIECHSFFHMRFVNKLFTDIVSMFSFRLPFRMINPLNVEQTQKEKRKS